MNKKYAHLCTSFEKQNNKTIEVHISKKKKTKKKKTNIFSYPRMTEKVFFWFKILKLRF